MARIDALLDIMSRLRDPDGGCPWDLAQNFASISPHTIEEAYEVDEAIASGDLESLRDELGDLLFQVVFQARLAEEEGAFDFEGVVEAIVEKLVRRHPHVFGDAETPSSVEGQLANWEEIKAAERAAASGVGGGPPDPFAGIPRNLPALARSAKISGRIDSLSAPPEDPRGGRGANAILDEIAGHERSIRERVAAAKSRAISTPPARPADALHARDERMALVGRGLRGWVDLARALGVDAEQALRRADDRRVDSIRANRLQASPSETR